MKKQILFFIVLFLSISLFSQKKPETKDDPYGREAYLFEQIKSPITGQVPKNIRQKELNFFQSKKSSFENLHKSPTATWINRGPWNVGGRTRALAIDVTNSNVILAAGVSGGVWRSTDGGNSWIRASIPNVAHAVAVTSIAQDTRSGHQQTWYYTTGEYIGNSASEVGARYRGNGVYKSVDSGKTWTQIVDNGSPTSFDSDFDYTWNVKVDPTNGYVYIAAYADIWKSTDGSSFSAVLKSTTSNNPSAYTDVEVASDGTLYATLDQNGDTHGIFISTNSGTNWTNITPSGFPTDYNRIVIAAAPSNPDIVYFLGETDSGHLLWIYDNSTGTWTDKTSMLPNAGGDTGDFDSQGGYDLVIKVKPDNAQVVFFGGTSLYRTTDGFSSSANISWVGGYTPSSTTSYTSYTNHHADQHSLFFDPNNTAHLYSGHDGGISFTSNCLDNTENSNSETIDWVSKDNGYLTTQDYVVAIDQSGTAPNDIIAGFQDNGTWVVQSSNSTSNWSSINSGDGAYCAIANNATTLYSASQNGQVYADFFSSNGSYIGWTRVYPDLNSPLFVTPYVIDRNTDNIMYILDDSYIWRDNNLSSLKNNLESKKAPADWVKLSNSQISSGYYSAIAVSKTPANIVYAGTSDGKIYKFVNPNNSDPIPTDITGTNFPAAAYVSCIAINPDNADKIIVTFSNYNVISIFYTENGGTSWTNVSGNLEENSDGTGDGPSVRWAAFLKTGNAYKYFVGTSIGLFSTDDLSSSTTWTQEAPNVIGNVLVDMVTTRSSDGTVVVGTHGNGIYSTQFASSLKTVNSKTKKLKIFPNPAKAIVNISIPYDNSKLLIHNSQGEIVFFANIKTRGNKVYDLSSLSQGVYFVRLYSGTKISQTKLVIE